MALLGFPAFFRICSADRWSAHSQPAYRPYHPYQCKTIHTRRARWTHCSLPPSRSWRALTGRLRAGWDDRRTEAGASTLELVILILGLITVATLLVAALTAAVRSRTDQIN